MNNQLAQKYNYYLNESHRLNEELQNEAEYSELLENILVELIGEEAFYGLFEDINTAAREREAASLKRAATARANKDSAEAHRAGEMGTADEADAAHNKASASAYKEISLFRKLAKQKASQTNVYGKGGKIVRRLPKRSTKK